MPEIWLEADGVSVKVSPEDVEFVHRRKWRVWPVNETPYLTARHDTFVKKKGCPKAKVRINHRMYLHREIMKRIDFRLVAIGGLVRVFPKNRDWLDLRRENLGIAYLKPERGVLRGFEKPDCKGLASRTAKPQKPKVPFDFIGNLDKVPEYRRHIVARAYYGRGFITKEQFRART